MARLTWARAAAWRAHRHHLDGRARGGSMLAVAGQVCGLHAQVMSSAELAAWARVERLERGAVARAVWEERTLVKTWAMRGTLHLLPSGELPQWFAVLGTSRRYHRPGMWERFLGVTLEEFDRMTEAFGEVLRGRFLTREELVNEAGRRIHLPKAVREVALNGWGTIFKPAAYSGGLCFGPSVGQRVQFTNPRTWVAVGPPADPQAAAVDFMRRYLAAYGPATHDDFHKWWGGAGLVTVRRWMADLGEETAEVEVDGAPALMLARDVREARGRAPARAVRLLPAFDPYVVGASRHADKLLPGVARGRVYRPQGWLSPVLLVDGLMQGVWRHEVKGSRVEVAIEPFVKLPGWARRGAEEEAERLAGFFGGALRLEWKQ